MSLLCILLSGLKSWKYDWCIRPLSLIYIELIVLYLWMCGTVIEINMYSEDLKALLNIYFKKPLIA